MANFGSAPTNYSTGGTTFSTGLRDTPGGGGGRVEQSANTDMGVISFDFTDPMGSIAESAGNIGDWGGGLVGGALGLVGQLGIPGVGNIGQIPEAIGNGIGAVGSIPLGGALPENATLGGTLGGGGEANVGAIPGAMMDVVGLPGRALERFTGGRRLEAGQRGETDLLAYLLETGAASILSSVGIGAMLGIDRLGSTKRFVAGDSGLPQDLQDALDAGEMTVDEAGDELVARNAGFSPDPAVNLTAGIVYDPMNLIGGAYGKAASLTQKAGIAVEAGGDVNAVNRVIGKTYNVATHGMTRTQQGFITKIAGPATAGVAQAIGPGAVRSTIQSIDDALGPELGGLFEDALATGNAHYVQSAATRSVAGEVEKNVSKAAETFTTPDEVTRLIDQAVNDRKAIDPKALIRDTENYARRTLPTVIDRDETIRKVAAITGTTVDDAARALGKSADDLGTQQTVHLAYWGKIIDDLAEAKKGLAPQDGLDIERLTPVAPDTLTDQRARDVFRITQDADGRTVIGASEDEIHAAVQQYDVLAKYRGDAYEPNRVRALVARMWEGDYLPKTLEPATAAKPNAIPGALGDVRARMNEFGYELGFAPEGGWRTLTDDAGEIIDQSPFLRVSSAKDPLTVRNKFGRFMDEMFRGITQDRIIYEARARMAARVNKFGINDKETATIFQRILGMSREQNVAPRGLVFGGERQVALPTGALSAAGLPETALYKLNRFDQAFLDVIGPERMGKFITQHDPTALVMQAFAGNWKTVGLSQTVSGGAKAVPRFGTGIAAISEAMYPMVKFKYNLMFQVQEMVETVFLSLLRGIDRNIDPDLAATYQSLIGELDEFRWLSGGQYTLNTASGESAKRAFGDSTIGKLAANVSDVQGAKKQAEIAQIIVEHPDEFQRSIMRVNPRLWKIMEDTYGTTDPATITRAFMRDRMAGSGSLQDALRLMDEAKPAFDDALKATLRGGDTIPADNIAASQKANIDLGVAKGGTRASGGAIKDDVSDVIGAAGRPATAAKPAARESDYLMETIWSAFKESARMRSEVAFRTHYFSASRSFFERTINHPYLGLYPASYMFGKVLPEFARFLVLRPFGLRAPLAGQAALLRVQEAYMAQLATDPEFGEWIKDNKDAIYLANMLLPASPVSIDARMPAYSRRIGQAAAGGNIDGPEDLANTVSGQVSDSLSYALGAPVNAIDTFSRAAVDLTSLVTGQIGTVEQSLDNAARMYDGMDWAASR